MPRLAWANPCVQNGVCGLGGSRGVNSCPRSDCHPGASSVYVPAAFAEPNTTKLHEFMRRHSFAVLTTHGDLGLVASHLPLLFDADAGPQGHLLGHMARANPQWKSAQGEVMAIFSGPHAYVSPAWYEESGT